MDRRRCLGGFGTVVAAGALAGCAGDGDGGRDGHGNGDWDGNGSRNDGGGTGGDEADAYGFLSTSVTDRPNDIDDFEFLVVTLEGIWVKPAGTDEGDGTPDASTSSSSSWTRARRPASSRNAARRRPSRRPATPR